MKAFFLPVKSEIAETKGTENANNKKPNETA